MAITVKWMPLQAAEAERRRDDVLVTFDLFSALIDSRTGGAKHLSDLARRRGWTHSGVDLYDAWDRHNKASQRDSAQWLTFSEHSRQALQATYRHFALAADGDIDVDADADELLASISFWPLWQDVASGLAALATQFRVGILSNVDDDLFRLTRVAPLVGAASVLTSQRLGAYKPAPAIYHRALEHAAGRHLVHVATSTRDVRGAIEAGLHVVRLVRPGHNLDPEGPRPTFEATSIEEVSDHLHLLTDSSSPDAAADQ